jgi:hypothetical protein
MTTLKDLTYDKCINHITKNNILKATAKDELLKYCDNMNFHCYRLGGNIIITPKHLFTSVMSYIFNHQNKNSLLLLLNDNIQTIYDDNVYGSKTTEDITKYFIEIHKNIVGEKHQTIFVDRYFSWEKYHVMCQGGLGYLEYSR